MQVNEHYKKAKNVCKRVGKPAQAYAKALDPSLQNKKRKFNAFKESVAAEKQL